MTSTLSFLTAEADDFLGVGVGRGLFGVDGALHRIHNKDVNHRITSIKQRFGSVVLFFRLGGIDSDTFFAVIGKEKYMKTCLKKATWMRTYLTAAFLKEQTVRKNEKKKNEKK